MQSVKFTVETLSAIGTPLVGDTLFGQLCWSLREIVGEAALENLLEGYCHGRPFLVVSDALMSGYVPLAHLPGNFWNTDSNSDRKQLKKREWLSISDCEKPQREWQLLAKSAHDILKDLVKTKEEQARWIISEAHVHNTINRLSGTTGDQQFAPFVSEEQWLHPDLRFDIYMFYDNERLDLEILNRALEVIAYYGYGKDASIGLGKLKICEINEQVNLPHHAQANAYLTLARCLPQGLGFDNNKSFYRYESRFGRLGAGHVQSGVAPFKKPLMMAKTGAVFSPINGEINDTFIGQGISGHTAHSPTVHQGYAPVLRIALEKEGLTL